MSLALRWAEVFGLLPIHTRLQQAQIALMGQPYVPSSKIGLSSLKLLHPTISVALWRGRQPIPQKVIITNLFNHQQTPIEQGWSVKKTQVQDFRGRDLTYDSHNGTDLCIPIGTQILAPATGRVVRVHSEFNRGGLKIYLDHGTGLMTSFAHLARALVTEGQIVSRGQPIALSGYSGLDGFTTFPWGVPHTHFNTWLNGSPVDPFSTTTPLWRGGIPTPLRRGAPAEPFRPAVFDEPATRRAIVSCRDPDVRTRLAKISALEDRAPQVVIEQNYYPTRFTQRISVYSKLSPRLPVLSLPFHAEDYDGVVFFDEV